MLFFLCLFLFAFLKSRLFYKIAVHFVCYHLYRRRHSISSNRHQLAWCSRLGHDAILLWSQLYVGVGKTRKNRWSADVLCHCTANRDTQASREHHAMALWFVVCKDSVTDNATPHGPYTLELLRYLSRGLYFATYTCTQMCR